MNAGPDIREASLVDVPALRHYAAELFSEGLPTLLNLDPDISLEEEEAFVRPYLDRSGWLLLVAAEGREIVGVLSFKGHTHPRLSHSGTFGISVRRDRRGCGIGARMLGALEKWATAHGFRRLELEVFASNTDAIRLYERQGFLREGCRQGAVLVEGEFIDLIEMAKVLV